MLYSDSKQKDFAMWI